MIKTLGKALAIGLGCLALFVLYLLGGTSSSETRVEYEIDVQDPASGILHVTMVIQPPVRPFLTLWLRDVNQGGLPRVENFSASRGGRRLPNWQSFLGLEDARNIWTGFSREPVEIRYDVNPRWVKGRSPKAFLGPDFGYFKGEIFLYSLIAPQGVPGMLKNGTPGDFAGQADVRFSLPDGWTLVSPWGTGELKMSMAQLRGVYFGAGPMSTATARVGDSTLLLGIYAGLNETEKDRFLHDVPHLFETIGEVTELAPSSPLPHWSLTVLPSEPIGGGSSGTSSLVTSNKLPTISHEMFHWWDGDLIETTPDANWVHEGFTTYYEGKLLYSAGIWTLEEFQKYLDTLYEEIESGPNGKPVPLNLVQASENLVRRGANEDYYKVYHGGALVAHFLDQELQKQGTSLDKIWSRLADSSEPITTEVFLQELEDLGGAELAQQCADLVHGRRLIP